LNFQVCVLRDTKMAAEKFSSRPRAKLLVKFWLTKQFLLGALEE